MRLAREASSRTTGPERFATVVAASALIAIDDEAAVDFGGGADLSAP
jgi:hypothetical protein